MPTDHITLTASGCVRGGGTGREFLSNLLGDGTEGWNKWFVRAHTAWVLQEFARPYAVSFVGMCSANDCPPRDPAVFDLLGRTVTGEWVTLAAVSSCPFGGRWEWVWYPVGPVPVCVTAVKLVILDVRRRGDCLQLGHMHVLGVPAE